MFFCHHRKSYQNWGGSVLILLPPEEEPSVLGLLCTCSSATRGRTIRVGSALYLYFCHERKNNLRWGGSVLVVLPPKEEQSVLEEEESALGRFSTCSSATIGRAISIGVTPYLFFCRQRKNHPCWGCCVLVLLPPEEGLSALGRLRFCSPASRGRTICIGVGLFLFFCHQRKNNLC